MYQTEFPPGNTAENPEMIEYTFDFPGDRSLINAAGCGKATTSILLPSLRHFSAHPEAAIVGFAALFVLSRILNQEMLQARLAAGEASGSSDRAIFANISPDATLAQAFATLRIKQASSGAAVNLSIREAADHSVGTDAELCLHREAACLRLAFNFDADRISMLSAQDFLEKIGLVLEALNTQSDKRCADLTLLGATARQLIPDLSREIEPRHYECVMTTFFRVATQYADHPAIATADRSYSYRELLRIVDRVTGQLIDAGLKPGEIVAITGYSSFGMLAGMLAVLSAGGVLVTLDRALPEERRKLIGEISKPRLHIEVTSPQDGGPIRHGSITISDWPDDAELNDLSGASPRVPEFASDAAYIFFTSGSTGVPKGVLGTHLGLAHFLDWQRSSFPIGPGDRVAQITALSFDVVLRDILFPLTSGACILIPKRELLFDARRMLKWIEVSGITAMHCVPSLMKAWLQAPLSGKPFQSLRYFCRRTAARFPPVSFRGSRWARDPHYQPIRPDRNHIGETLQSHRTR